MLLLLLLLFRMLLSTAVAEEDAKEAMEAVERFGQYGSVHLDADEYFEDEYPESLRTS